MTDNAVPQVRPSGLVTVAYLKARLDEGDDHLGIFVPIVIDVVSKSLSDSFVTADVQKMLIEHHGLTMPTAALETILRRLVRKGIIKRNAGRYQRGHALAIVPAVEAAKARLEQAQLDLASAFMDFALGKGRKIESTEMALERILLFLEEEQVALLLREPPRPDSCFDRSAMRAVVAEFLQTALREDSSHASTVRSILEGLVLYHAAFQPDFAQQSKAFQNLTVVLDSVLVRQAVGYEGPAERALMRETVDLLQASGATCVVFDVTLQEIRGILRVYEEKLATARGRESLHPVPMARFFLTEKYTPGDVAEMMVLLEHDVEAAGLTIRRLPTRIKEHVGEERALIGRLADPQTKDESQPRVRHDVDCVAAVLTMRRGRTATRIEDCGAIFATSASLVIRNVKLWFMDDQQGLGIEPIIHIRALGNLAWLKKPMLGKELKKRDLVALCAVVMRPERETWNKFIAHLTKLRDSNRISTDEVAAVLVSGMSDKFLREAEEQDSDDPDAATLDEVVDRVRHEYASEYEAKFRAKREDLEAELADRQARLEEAEGERVAADAATCELRQKVGQLEAALKSANVEADRARQGELRRQGRVRSAARRAGKAVFGGMIIVLILAGLALISQIPVKGGWIGRIAGIGMVFYVCLELLTKVSALRGFGRALETWLIARFKVQE